MLHYIDRIALVIALVIALFLGRARADSPSQKPLSLQNAKPNVVFILSDDQDLHMDSLSYMPFVQKHMVDQGTFYRRHFCTIALCCPSRVSLWTGKAGHNTNVTDVNPPYGGYPKFVSQGLNSAYLPVWLQESGYNTYYTGKLFNAHTVENYNAPFPAGFNGSDFLLDPYTYEYLNSTFQRNQGPPVSHEGDYSTDVVAQKAYGFLEEAVQHDEPFFLTIAPVACHSNVKFVETMTNGSISADSLHASPPVSAKRHEHLFHDAIVPRHANFNPEEPNSVSWIRGLERQNDSNVAFNDHFYRARLRSLQALDEIVDGIVTRLEDYGILDNTYIVYTTDNGYHIGQHRLQPGKECGFEEDINIPLVIRGPNVPRGEVTDIVTSHTDLAPTIFSLIGAEPRADFDGAAIPVTETGLAEAKVTRHEHVNVEYWGFALTEGDYGKAVYWNNTYKALRILGRGYNLYYSVWCNNEHELYDLDTDPYQITNIYPSSSSPIAAAAAAATAAPTHLLGHPIAKVIVRLDSLVLVLKSCKGRACTQPWEVLHPEGGVEDLHTALEVEYDDFYGRQQARVEFSRCEKGYIVDAEGPQDVAVFNPRWSEMV